MRLLLTALMFCLSVAALAQQRVDLQGKISTADDDSPVPFAYIFVENTELWAVADADGRFTLSNLPAQETVLLVRALGFEELKHAFVPSAETKNIVLRLRAQNLKLSEVTITAQRSNSATSSYVIGSAALEHQQLTNISGISQLLPGGKTISAGQNLAVADTRLQLRSEHGEMGNASFGTAIEIDGIRLNTNADATETRSADLRGVSTANIVAVEVVTGIASVEHGDLSAGLVRIRTKLGQTPLLAELSLSANTKQATAAKGVALGNKAGTINVAYDFARSTANIASPYTSYTRNALDVRYANTLNTSVGTLAFDLIAQGNLGGKNTEKDPDAIVDTYERNDDKQIRLAANLRLLAQKHWLTSVEAQASWTYANKQSRTRKNASSASEQPQIHARTTGYSVAQRYDDNPDAAIIFSPIGYWYSTQIVDNRPMSFSSKIKANLEKGSNKLINNLMVGAEYLRTYNYGTGVTYEDMRYAPTWRRSRYFMRPACNTVSFYAEDKMTARLGEQELIVVAGLRSDHQLTSSSRYGTVRSLSPRFSSKLTIVEDGGGALHRLVIGAGWGKAVKLPSFMVFAPPKIYSDQLAFAAGSVADAQSCYAYYSQVYLPLYNPDLRWQNANQTEVNVDAELWGMKLMISAYRNKTKAPYMDQVRYEPFDYRYTSVAEAEKCAIDLKNRRYSINPETGVVTVEDMSGALAPVELKGEMRRKFLARNSFGNGSPVVRKGIDFVLDLPKFTVLNTSLRFDGKIYHYKSLDQTLIQWTKSDATTTQGLYFPYLGHYVGSQQLSESGEGSGAIANSVANGKVTKRFDVNAQITTHVPKARLIVSLKLESTLLQQQQNLSQQSEGTRAFATTDPQEELTFDTDIYAGNRHVVAFPLYYSTIDAPDVLMPFLEKLIWAKQNDPALYSDLRQLVLKTNTSNYMNQRRVSAYCTGNLRVTKELGDKATVSFYATNFINVMSRVKETDSGIERTLYGSNYVPQFYYGLSFKIKI